MYLLSKPISSFTFSDIVQFCETTPVEGTQLDFKKSYPAKDGLKKHFAAFSNSRGGVIVLGVEEDEKSGLPRSWPGIDVDNKLMERIHQSAKSVDPLPRYDVVHTDAVNGKSFVLIRIYEGDNTPYYVQNDAHLHVRTGNVTKPIDDASPDTIELLFGKREKASRTRTALLSLADQIFDAQMNEASRASGHGFPLTSPRQFTNTGGELNAYILPYYPAGPLTTPRDLLNFASTHPISTRGGDRFPRAGMTPIPDGTAYLYYDIKSYHYWSEQVHASGLVYMLIPPGSKLTTGDRCLDLGIIANRLYVMLKWASQFYDHVGYHGSLVGRISLNKVRGYQVTSVGGSEYGRCTALLDYYEWYFEVDTDTVRKLSTDLDWFIKLVGRISWAIGIQADVGSQLRTLFANPALF